MNTKCKYPTCNTIEGLSKHGWCQEHARDAGPVQGFDLKRIQDRCEEHSKTAPKYVGESELETQLMDTLFE